jgi:preprotein translocase subunit SecE
MNLTTYLTETKAELKHVSWPTRRQTVVFTATVILMSLAVAFLLGFFDALFNALLKLVI